MVTSRPSFLHSLLSLYSHFAMIAQFEGDRPVGSADGLLKLARRANGDAVYAVNEVSLGQPGRLRRAAGRHRRDDDPIAELKRPADIFVAPRRIIDDQPAPRRVAPGRRDDRVLL